jgi:hypothetical protein
MHPMIEARYEMHRHWHALQAWKASGEPHAAGHVRYHAGKVVYWNRRLTKLRLGDKFK